MCSFVPLPPLFTNFSRHVRAYRHTLVILISSDMIFEDYQAVCAAREYTHVKMKHFLKKEKGVSRVVTKKTSVRE